MAIAQFKALNLSRLSSVQILEQAERQSSDPFNATTVLKNGGVEWDYPDDIRSAFGSADIDLYVVHQKWTLED